MTKPGCDVLVQSAPEHGVGDQRMTVSMAANAIWNKLNVAMSLLPDTNTELFRSLCEAQALADSIVKQGGASAKSRFPINGDMGDVALAGAKCEKNN